MEPQMDHHTSNLPSSTYDSHLDHIDMGPFDCPRCIADRAVERALEGK